MRVAPLKSKETPLYRTEDVLATLGMIRQHKLDVRTVTMGIDLSSCASPTFGGIVRPDREPAAAYAGRLGAVCRGGRGAVRHPDRQSPDRRQPDRRVSPPATRRRAIWTGRRTLDAVAAEVGVDLVGGFSALVQKGWTEGERRLIATLPEVLSTTSASCHR